MAAQTILDKVKGQEKSTTKLDTNQAGEIMIADDVVAMIACLAATETEGVLSVGNTYTSELMKKVGVHDNTKGVRVDISNGIVRVSLSIELKNGYSIPKTTSQVQKRIKSSVETMTGMTVKDVNVRVTSVEL